MKSQIMEMLKGRAVHLKRLEEYCQGIKEYADAAKYQAQWLEILMVIDEVRKIGEPTMPRIKHPLAPEEVAT